MSPKKAGSDSKTRCLTHFKNDIISFSFPLWSSGWYTVAHASKVLSKHQCSFLKCLEDICNVKWMRYRSNWQTVKNISGAYDLSGLCISSFKRSWRTLVVFMKKNVPVWKPLKILPMMFMAMLVLWWPKWMFQEVDRSVMIDALSCTWGTVIRLPYIDLI